MRRDLTYVNDARSVVTDDRSGYGDRTGRGHGAATVVMAEGPQNSSTSGQDRPT
jgi:hypothetical protein